MRTKGFLLFSSLLLLFFVLSSRSLHLPGLYYDEAYEAALAVDMLHPEIHGFNNYCIKLFGLPFPISSSAYNGALKSYLFVPVFLVFGANVVAVRTTTIFLALLTVVVTFFFAKELFSLKTALMTTLLLATDPSFIFLTRCEMGPVCLPILFQVSALYFFLRWWKTGRKRYFVIGALSVSLGLYERLPYAVFAVSSISVVLAMFGKGLKDRIGKFELSFGFFAFAIGLSLWALHAAKAMTMEIGISTLRNRLMIFSETLSGITVARYWFRGRVLDHGGIFPLLLGIGILTGGIQQLRSASNKKDKRILFILFVFSLMLTVLLSMRHVRFGYHFLYVYPLPHLICATALSRETVAFGKPAGAFKKAFSGVLAFLLFMTVTANLHTVHRIYGLLKGTGGQGHWTDAIYQLDGFLRTQKGKTVVCMHWGLQRNLFVVSNGAYPVVEAAWAYREAKPEDRPSLKALFDNLGNLYLVYSTTTQAEKFEDLVRSLNCHPTFLKAFYQRDGRRVYSVYTLQKPENSF